MTRIVVDLPAPLGPMNPVTWPGATVNDMPSSASTGPNRLRSPLTSIVASLILAAFSPVDVCLRKRLYASAGISPVSAAETWLIPGTWHCRVQVTQPRPEPGGAHAGEKDTGRS